MSNTLYPNTFQHHNAYIDRIAYYLTGNEEKVLNRILREIMGWENGRQTLSATVSLSILVDGKFSKDTGERLASGCGLKEGAVRNALATLADYGIIRRVGEPDINGQTYALNLEWDTINWEAMEIARTAREQGFATRMSRARQKNPLLLGNTPLDEQEAPPLDEQEAPPLDEQETNKPISKPKRKPTVTAKKQRAQDIAAAVAYHEITQLWPPRVAWEQLRAINNGGLARWEETVRAYVLMGWNPSNLKGMLEFYERGEIPGRKGVVKFAPVDPADYVDVDIFFTGGN